LVVDAWAEPPAQHGECGEVQFRVAMCIRIMFLDLHVAFVIEKAVKHESRIAVGAFDGHAVEGSVIIREEGIEFESEVAEACAVGLLEDPARQGEALPVTRRCPAFAPVDRCIQA
jgi:hypothetical protein